MSTTELSMEPADRAERLYQALRSACEVDLRKLANLLASNPDDQLLGTTEFTVRDIVHDIGAKALQTALDERKKGDTEDRA